MSFKPSSVSVIRDIQGNQIIYIDMGAGFTATISYLGPCVQATALGGEAVTIFADFQTRRFMIAPSSLKDSMKSRSPGLHHIIDCPALENSNTKSKSGSGPEITGILLKNARVAAPKTPKSSTGKSLQHVKRPRNSWIIYRSEKSKLLHHTSPGISAGEISSEVSRLWKNETEDVKEYYCGLADEEARLHKEKYPEYRYTPARQ
ncbi:high mobility group box domain-containing protein [Coniella lustricola]|uniref:High mobility group box domain-containing protein n=1 Tax=Coniella lustricola TaxID=2025994 RepID=A0A2T3ALL8_9PEZI|nr:high mobility group box domain-containing protein [Coniella lustricola]